MGHAKALYLYKLMLETFPYVLQNFGTKIFKAFDIRPASCHSTPLALITAKMEERYEDIAGRPSQTSAPTQPQLHHLEREAKALCFPSCLFRSAKWCLTSSDSAVKSAFHASGTELQTGTGGANEIEIKAPSQFCSDLLEKSASQKSLVQFWF